MRFRFDFCYLGELSDYRFTINRNVSVTGGAIVPSSLSNSFTIDVSFLTFLD